MDKKNKLSKTSEKAERSSQPDMSTFCVLPFVHQSTKTDGSIKVCCRAKGRVASVKDFDFKDSESTDLVDAWNWRKIRDLRMDLYRGVKNDMCKVCWDHEANGVESMRQGMNSNVARMIESKQRAKIAFDDNGFLDEKKYKPLYFEF